MKCPHCGREIESGVFGSTASLRINGEAQDVVKAVTLPAGKATRERIYKYRDPGVERPTLLMVTPHG